MDIKGLNYLVTLPLEELIREANRVRRECLGDRIELCGIVNAKSGACSEDCKFCAQSSRHLADINSYPLITPEEIYQEAVRAKMNGAMRLGIVTSGNSLTAEEIGILAEAIRKIGKDIDIDLCASLGALEKGSFQVLKDAGLSRYHHNIETSGRHYPEIVSTHDHEERINTIKTAKSMGFEVCSGGIIGMGETWQDRIDMAVTLKELDVDSVPLNMLVPIEGTPLGKIETISPADAIRTIAIFRLILRDKTIKVAAGRESVLQDHQDMIYAAGANGMMIGGYLTIAGRAVSEDLALVEEVRNTWKNE